MIYIGIDAGKHTGVAVWDSNARAFREIRTMQIHQALELVDRYRNEGKVTVIVEDARQRKYLEREKSISEYRGKLMGAGSVKRDCVIWEDFCIDRKIAFIMKAPERGRTKLTPEGFRFRTGWEGRTSNHARDAAMLVFEK